VPVFACTGIDYQYRENLNDLLEVEHHQGENEMSDEEYKRNHWRTDQLRPAAGGREFEPWTIRTMYMQQGTD
jgi:hypothetical protein